MADELAEETQKVIEALEGIERMKDPVARAAAISDVLKLVEQKETDWRNLRREVVLNLRAEQVPYRKIAALIHTSLGTVQSIERGHAGAWRTKPRTKSAQEPTTEGDNAGGKNDGNGGDS
ncbi:hypothetical protein H114_00827 [Streptomyces gancidicus BKS 13-15]|uniref:Uncharacterized protein n=1 Tax=Streptomyces gancidicus BKS 13-15 TaxID=1284664 RepID=M3D416_STREZ|nr:hypothetical protein [Streptomyces gancidicus]EMF31128.1 hypothetical protein H114_00827 [Streptomyces gancidicus BKS 13-15]